MQMKTATKKMLVLNSYAISFVFNQKKLFLTLA